MISVLHTAFRHINVKLGVFFRFLILMILAGCQNQSDSWNYVESEPTVISGGEGQPVISITRSCGPRPMGGYEQFDRGTFRIMSESSRRAYTWLSDDKREVVAYSSPIENTAQCFVNIRFEMNVSLTPIPKNQWELLPEEAAAYAQVYRRCEAIGSVVNNMYPRVIIDSVNHRGGAPVGVANTDAGLIISDAIDGCSHVVPAYTQGIIANSETASWRVFVSMDQIVFSRVK